MIKQEKERLLAELDMEIQNRVRLDKELKVSKLRIAGIRFQLANIEAMMAPDRASWWKRFMKRGMIRKFVRSRRNKMPTPALP